MKTFITAIIMVLASTSFALADTGRIYDDRGLEQRQKRVGIIHPMGSIKGKR